MRVRALLLWLIAALIFAAGETLYVLNSLDGGGAAFGEGWFLHISSLVCASIGVLVLRKLPRHAVGRVLYAIGILLGASYLLDDYAVFALQTTDGAWPLGAWAGAIEVVGATAFGLTIAILPLLFPDGRLPSSRWRPFLYAGAVGIAALTMGPALQPGVLQAPAAGATNPIGVPGARGLLEAITALGFVTLAVCAVAGLASLVVRWRRADGIEKRQIEWVAFGGFVLIATSLAWLPLRLSGAETKDLQGILFSIGFTAIPVTVAIAVLRYRLYDIDWIISRTLVYVPLTAVLAGLFVALTGLLRSLFTEATHASSDAAIALSTLFVAASLNPLKTHLQALVDRHFKEKPDAQAELLRLGQQARSVIQVLDRERFMEEYLKRVVAAFGASGGAIACGRESYSEGDWAGLAALSVPVNVEEDCVGYLALTSRPGDKDYVEGDETRLMQAAQVISDLARVHPEFRVEATTGLDSVRTQVASK